MLKFKIKTAGRTEDDGTKNVKIRVPLKYLSNFWRTLEMPLINCEINFILTWSNRCFIIDNPIAGQEPTFKITDTKLYVPVVTLSTTQDNAKLLEQSNNYYKMIAIDLSKQQALDADPKAIQQISFTAILDRNGDTKMIFIIQEAKETILDFSQGTVKVLSFYFVLI